jgi:AraC-like DNA-binding protein
MFYLIGIIVTFFLAIILLSKKGKSEADWILFSWLMVMGVHLVAYYLFATGKNYSFPHLLGFEAPLPLLHGPLLYLYTQALTNQIAPRKYRLVHFLPFLLSYLLFLQFFLLPAGQKISIYKKGGEGYETLTVFMLAIIILSGVVYVALSLKLLQNHKRTISNQFSYEEKINLAWLRYLIFGIGLIWVFVVIGNDPIIYSVVVFFVVFLGYFGINQVGIFTQKSPTKIVETFKKEAMTKEDEVVVQRVEPDVEISSEPMRNGEVETTSKKSKYSKSSLSPEAAKEIHSMLTEAMAQKKLYTNAELTLAELAQSLEVHPNNLSQVINTFEEKTFFDYINEKRVEEFKRIVSLPENQKFTLLALAHDCGFNSKTSFNRNFKNVTGLSPSEYLKEVEIELVEK